MEWTSITSAISLGVIAICAIVLVAIFWRRRNATIVMVERVITWITFISSLTILVLLTTYIVPDNSDKISFSLVTSVMAILVTVLVGWQVWQAFVSREQINRIEDKVRDIEQTVQTRIEERIKSYDVGNSVLQNFIMGRSSIQLHEIVKKINEEILLKQTSEKAVKTDLIDQSFSYIGQALQKLKQSPENEAYNFIYHALIATIEEFNIARHSILDVKTENIDRIIDAVSHDEVFRDGVNKEQLLRQLNDIKSVLPLR